MGFGINFLSETIKETIDSYLLDVNVCLPGKVTEFNEDLKTCSVQPSIRREMKSGGDILIPIVSDVPILYPRSGDSFIYFPLKEGDNVTLVVSQRSLDNWKISEEQTVTPGSDVKFNITDAFAFPGGYPETSPIVNKSSESGIEVTNQNSLVTIQDSGDIEINASGRVKIANDTANLISELISLIDALLAHNILVTSPGSPAPFIIPGPTQISLNSIKSKLEALNKT